MISHDERGCCNPFYVLALPIDCSLMDVERAGNKWLRMLSMSESARQYTSPFGPQERTEDLIRWAMAELKDPKRRLRHEQWVGLSDLLLNIRSTQPPSFGKRVWRILGWHVLAEGPLDR